MILENCKKRKRNLSCAWIDYKKAFYSVSHEWIIKSLELFKASPRVFGFLKHNMKNWKTHKSDTIISDNNIKRGIFQGDFLSPLLFCISLISLSLELNSSVYLCKIRTDRIAHVLYIDHLRLYAKDDSELEGLLRIVKGFNDDIDMEFGTSKCAKAIFKIMSDHVRLDEETMIKDLEQQKVYRSNRGRGLTKIELSYKASRIGLF